jgi:hypothetical protein
VPNDISGSASRRGFRRQRPPSHPVRHRRLQLCRSPPHTPTTTDFPPSLWGTRHGSQSAGDNSSPGVVRQRGKGFIFSRRRGGRWLGLRRCHGRRPGAPGCFA